MEVIVWFKSLFSGNFLPTPYPPSCSGSLPTPLHPPTPPLPSAVWPWEVQQLVKDEQVNTGFRISDQDRRVGYSLALFRLRR